MDARDDKTRLTFRRLLLASQLYAHGLDHSLKTGALNKMIAVHNFHNAIEIALRAIILQYEIRSDKTLNIDFETMLNDIDNYKDFKDKGIKLPYRPEVRNLNQLRNLVQHHAIEPETATMEDWRVFTKRFLRGVCNTYFELDFDSLSPLDMIDDPLLKRMLEVSTSSIAKNRFESSLDLSKIAFYLSNRTVLEFLPENKIGGESDDINQALENATFYAALFTLGINIVDYKRFISSTRYVGFALSGDPIIAGFIGDASKEAAQWVHDFVVTTIVHWQVLGLLPSVPGRLKEPVLRFTEKENKQLLELDSQKPTGS